MAMEDGNNPSPRRRNKPGVTFFYLNGELHKILRVIRAQDFVITWNYKEVKRKGYVWSDVRKRMGKSFTTKQVAEMVGKGREYVENDILNGNIRRPQRSVVPGSKRAAAYRWSEQDILDYHDYLLTVHRGRPRKDGLITTRKSLPSRAELKALMRHNLVTYFKAEDGTFQPVWKEHNW
jgi:hypothetical protein